MIDKKKELKIAFVLRGLTAFGNIILKKNL